MEKEKKRDLALDCMRGFFCFLMVFAHTQVIHESGTFEYWIFLFPHFFTGIYLATSGFLAHNQSKRDTLYKIILLYTLFFFLTFSFNCIRTIYFFDFNDITLPPEGMRIFGNFECEILQLIAIGCIVTAVVSKIFKERDYLYLISAIVLYALFLLVAPLVPQFPHKSFFISPGAFSVIPWIVFFFLGVFSYRTENRNNLILAAVFLAAFLIMRFGYGYEVVLEDRWKMPLNFVTLSYAAIFFSNFVFRILRPYIGERNIMVYLGRHSLLFLYLHYIFVGLFMALSLKKWYIAWPGVTVLTFLLILGFDYINKKISVKMYNLGIWIGLIILIWITPVVFNSHFVIIVVLEMIFGIILSLRSTELSFRIKKGATPA